MRNNYPFQFILFVFVFALFAKAEQRPNFVFIFADDFGYGDLASYGHPYVKSPNIDKLASQGRRFTQAYAAGATCNPSRTGIMTGISNARFEKRTDDFDFGDKITVTELLKKSGYATGHFGKWHIGMDRSNGVYGIDVNDSGGIPVRDSPKGRDTPIFDAAIDFIKQHKDKPFYVNIWGFTTHSPVISAQNYLDEFKDLKVDKSLFSNYMQPVFEDSVLIGGNLDENMRHYLGNVYAFDQNVKSVMDVLDELGLAENTIVVFSSDQGPQRPNGIGMDAAGPKSRNKIRKSRDGEIKKRKIVEKNMLGDTGPFKGNKGTCYDGGVRIPFIIRWPGKVKANYIDQENVISGLDWLPSVCRLVGIEKMPENIDGEDVSKVWLGDNYKREKPLFWQNNPGLGMRKGKWKYYLVLDKKRKIVGEELYDILNDPAEDENLSAQNPEIAKKLKQRLLAWKATLPKKVAKTGKYRHKYE
ncbi:sulfatase-like hydrolase/transferase [Lentisphaera marina]|uniref:sulfatase family protein n=1 Tax=Lentisphaera marina TaxID=1111041 RepID=UPI00236711CB|nr:sulfatase-like hydrolase/transferase [Lentisphaera marina]MDD7985299.1 sulfatase-like hydrolase/transferase [Lentisphaera marina]